MPEVGLEYFGGQGGKRQANDNRLRLGRQDILVGDHRYVGHVGWRQNHQSGLKGGLSAWEALAVHVVG